MHLFDWADENHVYVFARRIPNSPIWIAQLQDQHTKEMLCWNVEGYRAKELSAGGRGIEAVLTQLTVNARGHEFLPLSHNRVPFRTPPDLFYTTRDI